MKSARDCFELSDFRDRCRPAAKAPGTMPVYHPPLCTEDRAYIALRIGLRDTSPTATVNQALHSSTPIRKRSASARAKIEIEPKHFSRLLSIHVPLPEACFQLGAPERDTRGAENQIDASLNWQSAFLTRTSH